MPPGELNPEQTVEQRYWGDDRYRESMREIGWSDDTIGGLDDLYQAV